MRNKAINIDGPPAAKGSEPAGSSIYRELLTLYALALA